MHEAAHRSVRDSTRRPGVHDAWSHAYGAPPPRDAAVRLLNEALDLGYDHLDTAALYGFGANETLLGEAIGTGGTNICWLRNAA